MPLESEPSLESVGSRQGRRERELPRMDSTEHLILHFIHDMVGKLRVFDELARVDRSRIDVDRAPIVRTAVDEMDMLLQFLGVVTTGKALYGVRDLNQTTLASIAHQAATGPIVSWARNELRRRSSFAATPVHIDSSILESSYRAPDAGQWIALVEAILIRCYTLADPRSVITVRAGGDCTPLALDVALRSFQGSLDIDQVWPQVAADDNEADVSVPQDLLLQGPMNFVFRYSVYAAHRLVTELPLRLEREITPTNSLVVTLHSSSTAS